MNWAVKLMATLLPGLGLGLTAAAEPARFKPGEWSYNIEMRLMDQSFAEASTDCMSADDAGLDTRDVVREFAGGADCSATVVRDVPGSVTFVMACATGPIDTAQLSMDYESEQFQIAGVMASRDMGAGSQSIDMRVEARRLGDCRH